MVVVMTGDVRLSWFELFQAAQAGVMRQIEALKLGRQNRYGYDGDGWSIHVHGAAAELAVAKLSDTYWNSVVRKPHDLPGDVGHLQVRWRRHRDWDLIVHPEDDDESLFVLVVGEPPDLTVVGSIHGALAKRPEWYGDPYGTGRPAFFVPQSGFAVAS